MKRKPSAAVRSSSENCIAAMESNYMNYGCCRQTCKLLAKLRVRSFTVHQAKRPASRASGRVDRRRRQALTAASRLIRRSFHAASIDGGQNVCGTIIGTTLDGWISTGNQSPASRPSGRCERIATKLLSSGSLAFSEDGTGTPNGRPESLRTCWAKRLGSKVPTAFTTYKYKSPIPLLSFNVLFYVPSIIMYYFFLSL